MTLIRWLSLDGTSIGFLDYSNFAPKAVHFTTPEIGQPCQETEAYTFSGQIERDFIEMIINYTIMIKNLCD